MLRGLPLAAHAPASAVVALLLAGLADEATFFLPAGALDSFRIDLGLSYASAATVLTLAAPGAILGTAFSAAADHMSRRVLAAGGAFGLAVALAAFAAGQSFVVLAGASFLMGMAATAMMDATEVALVDMVEPVDLRRFLARGNLFGTLGDLAGPALLGVIALTGLSWRAAFWCAAAAMFGYGLVLATLPLPGPGGGDNDNDAGGEGVEGKASVFASTLAVVRDRRVWMIGAMAMLIGPFDETLLGFTVALVERDHGASTAVASVIAMVGVSGGLLAYTVLAERLHGVPDERIVLAASVTMTVGALGIAVAPNIVLIGLAAFVVSIGLNLSWLGVEHQAVTVRPGQVGTTSAVISVIECGGFAIPIAVGAVADRAGIPHALLLYGLIGGALFALAALGHARLRDRGTNGSPDRADAEAV